MKIIFDIDGTLTNYNEFVKNKAIPYIKSKYQLEVINPSALEIEDVFNIKDYTILKDFWYKNFMHFFALKFRKGVNSFFQVIKNDGHTFEIHTSRISSCNKDIKGYLIRKLTLLQFWINGVVISKSKIFFYKDDKTKIKGIIKSCPDLVFEDKSEIVNSLSSMNIKVICVKGLHNKKIEPNNYVQLINEFNIKEIKKSLESLFGELSLKYHKREAKSSLFFNYIKLLRPLIMIKFNPIVLHKDNICYDSSTGIIFAPNHRSTWDPIIITAILKTHIHWAALLRFFEAKDSIFNNRKNYILCKITSKAFKNLDYFPIERKKDNKNANNFNSIKDMNNYLKIKSKLGIFAEGTTKRPPEKDFGHFDKSFIMMAKRNNSIIQPITVTWINNKKIKHKVIVNFAKPFFATNMKIDDAMNLFINVQQLNLKENENLKKIILEEKENEK